MPLSLALGRLRQVELCEFETSLIYKANSRTVRAVTQKTLSQKTTQTKTRQKTMKTKKKYNINNPRKQEKQT